MNRIPDSFKHSQFLRECQYWGIPVADDLLQEEETLTLPPLADAMRETRSQYNRNSVKSSLSKDIGVRNQRSAMEQGMPDKQKSFEMRKGMNVKLAQIQ